MEVFRKYEIPYAAFNPGASFRGIHDSLVNYLGNKSPQLLQCNHEEISVAIAHGYAKASGKPMIAITHNVVGLQHATMAIHNAWCDRIPVIVIGGTGPMSHANRRPGSDWVHTALVQGNLVRDYVKWDDQPSDLESVPQSFARAYQLATTEPTGPVYVCYDAALQEQECDSFPELPDPKHYQSPAAPTASPQTIERIAEDLFKAKFPVIIADRLGRSAVAYEALLGLAELLMIPVIDKGMRHNFPNQHPLAVTEITEEVLEQADYILALDVMDLYGGLHTVDRLSRETAPMFPNGTAITHVTLDSYLVASWSQDYYQLQATDCLVSADTSIFMPQLTEKCAELIKLPAYSAVAKTIKAHSGKWQSRLEDLRAQWIAQAEKQRPETPIALSTLAMAVWNVIQDQPWILANGILNRWVQRLWNIERQDQYLGKHPGGGLGYGIGAAIGVALAHPDHLCVNLQGDGDFLYTPTALWTAVHHKIPLLTIMANNRSYYNSEDHGIKIAAHRGRPVENAYLGNRIEDPAIDFAQLAQSMGVYAEGPILTSKDIEPALRRALHVIKTERRPTLVDVVTQNR